MENFLKPDKPLLSNVHRTHLQNWGVVSFLSPEDKTKTIIMNSLNDILSGNKVKTLIDNVNDKIMCCLKDEVKKLIKTKYFTEDHKKDIKNRIKNIYKKY